MNTTTNEQTNRLVGVNEMARLAGLSPSMIYKFVRERTIPYVKLGRHNAQKAKLLFNVEKVLAELQRKYTIPTRSQY